MHLPHFVPCSCRAFMRCSDGASPVARPHTSKVPHQLKHLKYTNICVRVCVYMAYNIYIYIYIYIYYRISKYSTRSVVDFLTHLAQVWPCSSLASHWLELGSRFAQVGSRCKGGGRQKMHALYYMHGHVFTSDAACMYLRILRLAPTCRHMA